MAFVSGYSDIEKAKIVDQYNNSDDKEAIARLYNVHSATIRRWRQKQDLAEKNDHKIPMGMSIKGVSTLYDPDGNVKQEWVKVDRDKQKQEQALIAFVEGLKSKIEPAQPIEFKGQVNDDLLSLYVLTDYHIGMMAWHKEGGDNWDLDIAEHLLVKWFKSAINSAPDSKTAVLAELGDFMHFDSLESKTPASGHILDADSRLPKIVTMVIRVLRQVISMLLEKHEHVHFIPAEGNHNEASSVWVRAMFDVFYENEPRVTVDNTHTPYYCYEFGDVSLFFHHGHKKRINNVSEVFAGMFRDVFGRTKFSYGHMGHLHHKEVKENSMMIIEQHQTLAAKDAYASRGGYLSNRSASVINYHRNYGEVGRVTISPDML